MENYSYKLELLRLYFHAMRDGQPSGPIYDFSSQKNNTRLSNAAKTYGGGVSSLNINKVLALYDTTLWDTGERGYIFCTDCFYYNSYSEQGYIRYKDVESVEYYRPSKSKDVDRGLVITLKDGRTRTLEILSLNATPFLAYIQEMALISSNPSR